MGMAIDGLISGLKTTDLINSLMQAEAIPQTLLKNKVTDSTTYITAMQALNTKVAALADAAGEAREAGRHRPAHRLRQLRLPSPRPRAPAPWTAPSTSPWTSWRSPRSRSPAR